jgi:hypothetical protein
VEVESWRSSWFCDEAEENLDMRKEHHSEEALFSLMTIDCAQYANPGGTCKVTSATAEP